MKKLLLLVVHIFLFGIIIAQSEFNYSIRMDTFMIPGMPGLHSYAYAQADGKWLIIGGRLDGIHARQPFNAFPASHNNRQIFVADPENAHIWKAGLEILDPNLQAQLQSTNMQFHQDGPVLLIAGGYGYNADREEHITHPFLTIIQVPQLINAIIEGEDIEQYFQQIEDDRFAVTGGNLGKIDDEYYLIGGHRFDGEYNPMDMPTFTQQYTDAIRIFRLDVSGEEIFINGFSEMTDPVHLHRRDYNLLPQIFPDGRFGYTLFAGVFQLNEDLPFLYPVDIVDRAYFPRPEFNQYLNHYHTAHIPLYEKKNGTMHNLFFGGISQYYYLQEKLLNDELVPFVKTISRVSRSKDGRLEEARLPIDMPGYFGAGAEFILNENLPLTAPGIVQLTENKQVEIFLGYIYGGIESERENVFFFNNTDQSAASAVIFKIYLVPQISASTSEIALAGYHDFKIIATPNPNSQKSFYLHTNSPEAGSIEVLVTDSEGRLILNKKSGDLAKGENQILIQMESQVRGLYFITSVLNGKYTASTKMIFQ